MPRARSVDGTVVAVADALGPALVLAVGEATGPESDPGPRWVVTTTTPAIAAAVAAAASPTNQVRDPCCGRVAVRDRIRCRAGSGCTSETASCRSVRRSSS